MPSAPFFFVDLVGLKLEISNLKSQLMKVEDGLVKRIEQLERGSYTDLFDTPEYSYADHFDTADQFNQSSGHFEQGSPIPYSSSSSSCSSLFNVSGQPDRYNVQKAFSAPVHPIAQHHTSNRTHGAGQNNHYIPSSNVSPMHPTALQQPAHAAQYKPSEEMSAVRNTLPIPPAKNSLPSSEIKKNTLIHSDRVLERYSKMKTESKIGTLAVKLARQSFFGDDIMKCCTVQGIREFPALPSVELGQLKQTLFQLFPQYWKNPAEFESVWSTCIDCVGQACKRLRSKVAIGV